LSLPADASLPSTGSNGVKFASFNGVGSEGAHRSAGPRPPLKPDVRFSRIRLSQRCVSDVMSRKESAKQD
jgi:hypothetical protein